MKPARLAITALLLQLFIVNAYSQEAQVIDQVVAVVGGEHILLSDIEQEFLRQKMEGSPTGENNRCNVLEQILIQKLLLTQAKIDSLKTNESSVEMEIDRRLKYFTSQLGSEKALENYANKLAEQGKQQGYNVTVK